MCGPGQDNDNFWLSKPFGLDVAALKNKDITVMTQN